MSCFRFYILFNMKQFLQVVLEVLSFQTLTFAIQTSVTVEMKRKCGLCHFRSSWPILPVT